MSIPTVPRVEVALAAPNRVTMKGTITLRDAAGAFSNFVRTLHDRAREDRLREVRVDVTGLKFVHSSGIRLFVDWATWVKAEPNYTLRFGIDRRISWQKTSFSALLAMVGNAVVVDEAV